MMIGHLPASYIMSTFLEPKLVGGGVDRRRIYLAGFAGAIAPDIDLLYFYLIDNRQHHHHSYWTHYPIVWAGLLALAVLWFRFGGRKSHALPGIVCAANGIAHMVLDTIAGEIAWFAPFIDQRYVLFTVPARYDPWWLNFIFHWSFALELALLFWAVFLWWRKRARR